MLIQCKIIDDNLLEKLCKLIQKEIPLQNINLDFKDVLKSVYINNKEYCLSPFMIDILSDQLYNCLLLRMNKE